MTMTRSCHESKRLFQQPLKSCRTVVNKGQGFSPCKIGTQGLEQFQCRCIVECGETLRQTGNGEIVWGRSAAQAAAGPRPWGRNTRATGGALLGERAVGMEDLRPA